MNASRMSVRLMIGAQLWAVVQDMPARDVEGSPELREFDTWAQTYPGLVRAAKALQASAFESCLRIDSPFAA
jgi:hypothetical protein